MNWIYSLIIIKKIDAQVALVVYDITNKESFDCAKNWVKELKQNASEDISNLIMKNKKKSNFMKVLAFVGNKIDLVDQEKVDVNDASNFAKVISLPYNEYI